MDGADDRRDEVLVGTITRQYSFLFVLSLPEIEWLYCISLSLCLLPSFPSASLKVNVLTTLQNTQSIPPSPPAPTHLEQPWGTPHGASPTVSFSAPLSPTSFGGQGELQFENLKNETESFNTEWKKKIEDELREREEGVPLIWRGRSVSPTSKKVELTQPLSLLQQARLENNDVMGHLEAKRSTAAGPIQSHLTPAVLWKYVIPASRVGYELRGHSRIVRELVLLLLFWLLLIPHKPTVVLSSPVPRIASSPWTAPSLWQ